MSDGLPIRLVIRLGSLLAFYPVLPVVVDRIVEREGPYWIISYLRTALVDFIGRFRQVFAKRWQCSFPDQVVTEEKTRQGISIGVLVGAKDELHFISLETKTLGIGFVQTSHEVVKHKMRICCYRRTGGLVTGRVVRVDDPVGELVASIHEYRAGKGVHGTAL